MIGALFTAIVNIAVAAARFFLACKSDPEKQAFKAKAEEARVMEAPQRPESRVNDILLQHDERGD